MKNLITSLFLTLISVIGLYLISALEVALFSIELARNGNSLQDSKKWLVKAVSNAGDLESFLLVSKIIFIFLFVTSLHYYLIQLDFSSLWTLIITEGLFISVVIVLLLNVLPSSAVNWRREDVLKNSRVIRAVYILTFPFKVIAKLLLNLILNLAGMKGVKSLAVQKQLAYIADDQSSTKIEDEERLMIKHIIDFVETTVREVMVPRIDMVYMSANSNYLEVIDVINKHGHSRIPLYGENIDDIVGIIYAKDLLLALGDSNNNEINLLEICRKPYYVPESKLVSDLLEEFKRQRVHIAVVVDEYGGVAGIVTMEDLLEEIIGEIQDEYDMEEELINKLDSNVWLVNGRVSIDELAELLDIEIEYEEAETVGGLIYDLIGAIPKPGEKVNFEDKISFIVDQVDGQRIKSIKVIKKI
jgi:CBS domain containing-hemolysin-like protein